MTSITVRLEGSTVLITDDGITKRLEGKDQLQGYADQEEGSLWHVAAKLDNYVLAKLCEESGVDITKKNKRGQTAEDLLKKKDSLNYRHTFTIIHIADSNNTLNLINSLLKNSQDPTEKDTLTKMLDTQKQFLKIYRELEEAQQELQEKKRVKREIKKRLEERGPLTSNTSLRDKLTLSDYSIQNLAPNLIESVLFIENEEVKSYLEGRVEELYNCEILKPMMNFMAVTALGNKELVPDKHFKIFILDSPLLENIGSPLSVGSYHNKNSVFIASSGQNHIDILSTLMHESLHYVLTKVINNSGNPCPKGDTTTQDEMKAIIAQIRSKISSATSKNPLSEQWQTFNIFDSDSYKQEDLAGELTARGLEIIVKYGPSAGYDWLKTNIPDLLTFLEKRVNKHILEFLEKPEYKPYFTQESSIDTEPLSALENAAKNRDLTSVAALLQTKLNDEDIYKAFCIAVEKGYDNIMTQFLSAPNINNLEQNQKIMILIKAHENNDINCIKLLVEKFFDDVPCFAKIEIIKFFIRNGYKELVLKFLNKLDENTKDSYWLKLRKEAIFMNDLKLLRAIIYKESEFGKG